MGGFIMKKKILCLTAAIVMAMTSSAFAADKVLTLPERASGNVTVADTENAGGAADYEGLTAYDAAVIYEYAKNGVDYGTVAQDGNYDGTRKFGKETDEYVTASDAELVLKVVKNPKLVEDKCITVYTSLAKIPGGTFGINEDHYNDDTTLLDAIDYVYEDNKGTEVATQVSTAVNNVINNMNFYSADLGRNVALTEEGGWQIFVQAIEPLLACNGTTVASTEHAGWIDLEKSSGDSYENLKKIQDIIVTNKKAELTFDDVHTIVKYFEAALPGDKITPEAIQTSYAGVYKMFSQKYNVDGVQINLKDKGETTTIKGLLDLICDKALYKYETTTLKTIIDNVGTDTEVKAGNVVIKVALYERAMNDDL
jgi:hypothetical protein